MNALQQFLIKNTVENVTEKIKLGGRLKDFEITVQALTGDQYSQYQQLSVNQKKREFNVKKFNELVVVNCLKDPNLKDPEMLKESGCVDPAALLYRVFLAGEINAIADKILKLSGFDKDIEEDMEEVKN